MATQVRKRSELTMGQKLQIIQMAADNFSQTKIARRFGCSQSSVYRILCKSDDIKANIRKCTNQRRKRMRFSYIEDVERALLVWYKDACALNIRVKTNMLLEKASEMGSQLGHGKNFTVSNGWLSRWKTRYNIKLLKQQNECAESEGTLSASLPVPPALEDTWSSEVLQDLFFRYDQADVFVCDETALYFRHLPHPWRSKSQPKHKTTHRLTLLLATNLTGEEKLPMQAIGFHKYADKQNDFLLPYDNNVNAWMTADIFNEWLDQVNSDMARADRNIALVLDECAAHRRNADESLSNVELLYLPPNTAVKQPMECGIVDRFKTLYRTRLLQHHSNQVVKGTLKKGDDKLALETAMALIKASWEEVEKKNIYNSCGRAGFIQDFVAVKEEELELPAGLSKEAFGAYVAIDNHVACHRALSDEQICETINMKPQELMQTDFNTPPPRVSNVRKAMKTIKSFLKYYNHSTQTFNALEKDVKKLIESETNAVSEIETNPQSLESKTDEEIASEIKTEDEKKLFEMETEDTNLRLHPNGHIIKDEPTDSSDYELAY